MSNSSRAVSKQWDPAVTAFSTVDRLRGLVAATTKDDVQLSAVLAIERLGASLIVSPNLISDGVDALKGNESVRLADARLLLGLSWGGLAAQMRLSTACVRAFLLISALKVCTYDDLEIAGIVYEYLSGAKLLDLEPVSVQQLKRLIDVVAGYSNSLMPSVQHTMDEVIKSLSSLGSQNWPPTCFNPLAVKSISEIFIYCFEAIQQDEGRYIELSGQDGLIWIVTVLLWLCPDEVGFFSQKQCLIGATKGKVQIIVDKAYDPNANLSSSWRTRAWTAGKSIITIISAADDYPSWLPPRRKSAKILRKNVRYYYLCEGYNEFQLDLLGAIAAGMIDAQLQFGRLRSGIRKLDSRVDLKIRNQETRLKCLYEQTFVQKGGHVIEEYGWELDKIKDYATRFCALFRGQFHPDLMIELIASLGLAFEIHLKPNTVYGLALRASVLANNALASAQVNFGTLVQFYYPNLGSVECREVTQGIVLANMSYNEPEVDYQDLLNLIYIVAGGGDSAHISRISTPKEVPSIFSSEGRVLFPQVMLDHSTRQASVLAHVVVPGRIHYEDLCFDSVVNVLSHSGSFSNVPRNKPIRAPIFDMTSRELVLQVPYEQSQTNLQFYFAKDQSDQSVLLMRTCLSSTQDNSVFEVNYQNCIRSLARAVHVEKTKPPQDIKDICKELRPSMFKKARHNEVTLTPSMTGWGDGAGSDPQRLVTYIPDSQELRFFAAQSRFRPRHSFLYVLQDANLIEALHTIITNEKRSYWGDHWKLITGNDP